MVVVVLVVILSPPDAPSAATSSISCFLPSLDSILYMKLPLFIVPATHLLSRLLLFLLSFCFQLLIPSLLSLYNMVWRWRGTTWDVYFFAFLFFLVHLRLLWLLYMVSLVVVVEVDCSRNE